MASKMASRNKCKGVLYIICYTDLMYFNTSYNDIYFCCICLNFFKIHLNVVSMESSMSNSRPNTKNSEKRQIVLLHFIILPNFTKMGRGIIYQSKLQCIGFNYFK